MRTVTGTEGKDRQQGNRREKEQCVDDALALQLLIIKLHRQQHHDKANRHPGTLLDDVVKLAAIVALSHYGGSAVDHHHTKQGKPRRCGKEPVVWCSLY